MNKIDDNFEKFLMDKVKEENSQFNTPSSFNNRIEDVLNKIGNIDNKSKRKWYENKKYLAAVAALVFVFSLGIIRYKVNYQEINSNIQIARSINESSFENDEIYDNGNIYLNDLIDLTQVESITLNDIEIKDENQISELLYLLNNISLKTSTEEFIDEKYIIKIKGEKTYIIYMKENLLFINNTVYEGNTLGVENLRDKIKSITDK